MILLVIVCLIFMIGSFYLILEDHKIIGSIFGATSFLTLVGSFIGNINELSGNDDISKQKQNKK